MEAPTLLELPAELLLHILTFLGAAEVTNVAKTCRHLYRQCFDDQVWQPIVNAEVPGKTITSYGPASSFHDLYVAHHPHWFLTRKKIWFSDSEPHGKLLITRYDEQQGVIEAFAAVASRGFSEMSFWEKDREVIIHSFHPRISLDFRQPVVRLNVEAQKANPPNDYPSDRSYAPESNYSKETLMETFSEAGLYGSFMLCRTLPDSAITEQTKIWPPLSYPATSRARNDSQNNYRSAGHRPTKASEVSHNNFRLRKWVEYAGRRSSPNMISFTSGIPTALGVGIPYFASGLGSAGGGGMSIRMPEDITTYASLPESCYTPTAQKPWQGIWCGDYSGHGCEFIAIIQPDAEDMRPLPRGTGWLQEWFKGGRRGSSSSDASFVSAREEMDSTSIVEDDDSNQAGPSDRLVLDADTLPPAAQTNSGAGSIGTSPGNVPSGRLEAIKITGDPNIPRGHYTFIAPDIGHGGFLRIADEATFRGARVVRSAGHIAGRGFRSDQYTPSQLILISHNTLAQFWEGFGHISYYQRVDLDALTQYNDPPQSLEAPEQRHFSAMLGHF
ncbi:hypothetical protein DOTSEDRAFT_30171 [Dothistroma septosporum NZE10]|uniref:F-box domain-containing protein n=1 Tax=Dothistroma septosporum (strain NZE10 / CBS 128990) TaxID=675120 RepID=N1PZ28_DOTSN|nr:hypothetical protein DOTSEDRAFT_30171 [Dothistroma septosporum NZE10]